MPENMDFGTKIMEIYVLEAEKFKYCAFSPASGRVFVDLGVYIS